MKMFPFFTTGTSFMPVNPNLIPLSVALCQKNLLETITRRRGGEWRWAKEITHFLMRDVQKCQLEAFTF